MIQWQKEKDDRAGEFVLYSLSAYFIRAKAGQWYGGENNFCIFILEIVI